MDQRYSLRFETGERAGETIPVQGQSFSIGRRTGNSLQLLDNSVSGRHAEITVDQAGATLRDLGSTNGTRVGSARILEARLSNGDRVLFGNVEFVFLDSTTAPAPPSAAAAPAVSAAAAPAVSAAAVGSMGASVTSATAVTTADTLHRVRPEVLARSRKRSIAGLVGVAALLAGGGALWFFLGRGTGDGEGPVRVAQASPDNLLGEDYSFENGSGGWKAVEGAPAAFLEGSTGRVSGAAAVSSDLSAGAFAVHRSRDVRAAPGTALEAKAVVQAEGGASVRIGIELTAPESDDTAGSVVAWSPARRDGDGSGEVAVSVLVPPGYESARVLLLGLAEQSGTAAADDVSLAPRESGGSAPLSVGDWQLSLLGEPPTLAVLARFGRVLLSGLAFANGCTIPDSASAGPIAASAQKGGISVASNGSSGLCLRAESALARAGLATIGAEGYATHGLEFEREGVTSLLIGKGGDLVRLAFATPVRVTATAEGPAVRVSAGSAAGTDLGEVLVQLDFAEERRQAGDLAYKARNAEKKGDLGESLGLWSDLLNRYPYEEQLVQEAESKRAAFVQQGLSELAAVRMEIERARFFRLVDLYRQCREKALAAAARYRGSEVDVEAQKVAAEVETEISGLEADLARAERARVESILAALEAQKAAGLAGAVRDHLASVPAEAKN